MLNTISSSSTTYASKTFLCIKTDYNDVTSGTIGSTQAVTGVSGIKSVRLSSRRL